MRLLELGCDQPSFHTLSFNPVGLNLIVGNSSSDKDTEGSSNGVGKTLALGLVHHCLGANADPRLKKAVPNWLFRLSFELESGEHIVERSGDGKKIKLDGRPHSLSALRNWLDNSGIFTLEENVPGLSFRSLFKRFARYKRDDCADPLRTSKEQDFDARLRTLYLMGLDCSLAVTKRSQKSELDGISQSLTNWQHDAVLKDMFRAGSQPKVRSEWLDREIPRLKNDLGKFQVAEDYRAIELQAGELTQQLRAIERQQAVVTFQLNSIERSLVQEPDISKEELLKLYEGLQSIFKPEALEHFDAVEQFHGSLAANRRQRLEQDRVGLQLQASNLEGDRKRIADLRDKKLQSLHGKRALDEYASIANQLATYEEERQRLREFFNYSTNLQNKAQEIRERRVEQDRVATEYVATNPVAQADKYFTAIAELMYPRYPSGIVLENNTGDNQVRFNLTVQIEGDDSDGINAARILCFDWFLLTMGAHHTMDFLWHDNRLFAHIDPGARAAWFQHIVATIEATGKQYIASLNTENFDAMKESLPVTVWDTLNGAVRLRLTGDKPENKLLGIQFGK